MNILVFLTAMALSAIAGYYSIIGLAAIFLGAFWPVVIMGSVLEIAKLVMASWLYRNWDITPVILKTYLTSAVLVLMLITSIGIFGFLSKAHIESTVNLGTNTQELRILETQENIARDKLDYLLKRAKDPATASNKLDKQIQETQKNLTDISTKKLPLLKEETKLSVDVGPLKYVAEMFYGKTEEGMEKAVRMMILIIMFAFDPLAVSMFIAVNIKKEKYEPSITQIPAVMFSNDDLTTEEEPDIIESIRDKVTKSVMPGMHTEEETYENRKGKNAHRRMR